MKTLGIDLGTNSLGWCLIETNGEPGQKDEGRIVDIGTRIFSAADMAGRDAKSKESLAVARRQARTMRRQRDRRLKRKARLLEQLTEYGLMPSDRAEREKLIRDTGDKKGKDLSSSVLALRTKALDEKLSPHELGRVLFQLQQRRGFKSNRKADSGDNESGKIKDGTARLGQEMIAEGARTYGEFLYKRRLAGKSIRTRLRPVTEFSSDPDAKGDGYQFYPDRAELEKELAKILSKQAGFHPQLLSEARLAEIKETILYQRPLRPTIPGKCSYNTEENRLPKAHPLFQAFRLYKEVNELELIDPYQNHHKLTPEQRDVLILKLRSAKTAKFDALRKVLKLGSEYHFNKHTDNRDKLVGDEVYVSLSDKKCFGAAWGNKSIEEQWQIIEKLRDEADPLLLRQWLEENTNLDDEHINAVMAVKLPEGYGRLGHSALSNLLDAMKNETDESGHVITEAKAAQGVYGKTNSEDDLNRRAVELLPKYQEVLARHIPPGQGGEVPDESDPAYDRVKGRITNPTVHIALNQLRRVVNALIKKHGTPDRIAIELGRELKLNDEQRKKVDADIGKNTKAAIRRSVEIRKLERHCKNMPLIDDEEELLNWDGSQWDNGYNRIKLKLWEELDAKQPLNKVCVYTGETINIEKVLSDETEVDHILPRARTLDDSNANKILCMRRANRIKTGFAPAEVASWQDHYDEILARANRLPKNKRWRFAKDAMKRFEEKNDFAARQLTDTQYLSRMACIYLNSLYSAKAVQSGEIDFSKAPVRALPGRTTFLLRREWGLDGILPDKDFSDTNKRQNRKAHRHHSIDACVIACCSRSMIQAISTAARRAEESELKRFIQDLRPPWPNFRNELRDRVLASIVSHKPDHGTVSRTGYDKGLGQTAGQLHNDTAYGLTNETDEKGNRLVVRRKMLDSFTSEKDLMAIRDAALRDTLWTVTRDLSGDQFKKALADFSAAQTYNGKRNPYYGMRHIRVLEPLAVIEIKDKDGKPYKGYKGDSNYRYDVWQLPDGKWASEVVSTFDAHQPGWQSAIRQQYATAKKVLSLQQNDMVAIERDDETQICRVVKFNTAGALYLSPDNEAGALKARDADKQDPFKYIQVSGTSLKKSNARQIRIDELGKIFDPGSRN